MNRDAILQRAINRYGEPQQVDMLHEEIGELLQAINKHKRIAAIEGERPFEPPTLVNSLKYCLSYWSLCSEVADCKIMLSQLEKMLNGEAIEISTDRKIARLDERLNKSKTPL